MKKVLSVIVLLAVTFVICSCSGGNSFVGSWYDGSDPDDTVLELHDDGMFSYGDIVGNYYVEESQILVEPSSSMYTSDVLTISEYAGEECLIDSDGVYYFNNYDSASSFYNDQKEEEEKLKNAAFDNFKEHIIGTWYLSSNSEITLIFNEDGTFEGNDPLYESSTGTWEANKVDSQYFEVKLIYSNGETANEWVFASSFETIEDIEEFDEHQELAFGVTRRYVKDSSRCSK